MKIFKNGNFISCEEKNRVFSVLVEDQGRIVCTGNHVPDKCKGAETIDLNGACVVPAFADTHMHFESYALFHSTVDVRNVKDFGEMDRLFKDYIKKNPKVKFLPAYGCSAHIVEEKRLPSFTDLDKMVDIPLLIVKYDGHAAVANSALIREFPEEVVSDPGFNKETGWLYQNAFYKGVNFITQKVAPLKILSGMQKASVDLAKAGIGYVHSVEGVGYKNDIDVDTIMKARLGLCQCFRVYFQTMDVKKVKKRGMKRIGGCFSLALDGCFGSEDAALSEGYANNPENKGFLAYSQEEVDAFCIEANREGLQITMHAIGDVAVEQALDAYEKALSDTPREDHRHIIIHADLIPPNLQERAARMGIAIAVQPAFLDWPQEPDEYLRHILGNRVNDMIPLRSMLDAGVLLSAGSDAPCTIPDPIKSIHNCCNHPNSKESITVLEALKMHTLWAARTGFDEEMYGSLSKGKICDFVTLDQNILNVSKEAIKDIRIQDVYFRGRKFNSKSPRNLAVLAGNMVRKAGARYKFDRLK